jgi:hypothetical protein
MRGHKWNPNLHAPNPNQTTMAAEAATSSSAAAPAPFAAASNLGLPGPISIDTQHEDFVHDAQMDYYGSKLATCSSGKLPGVCVCVRVKIQQVPSLSTA